ncbi:MAG: phospholipase D-like domain-containing protein [Candidatus Micrarchaeaceae archaeon]
MRKVGKGAYKDIETLIRNGKRIFIISPYIDPYYAKFLCSMKGKRIFIISSNMSKEAKKIIEGRINKSFVFLSAFALSVMFFSLYFGYSYILIFASIIFAVSIRKAFSSNKNIEAREPKEFTHAKLYMSEDLAIVGSVNLTFYGTHKNIETWEIIDKKDEIEKLLKKFRKIWKESYRIS